MKNLILCLTLLCSFAAVSLRAAPPTDQSIEQLLSVMQVETMFNQMMSQMDSGMRTGMEQGLKESLKGKPPTPAQQIKVDAFQKNFSAVIKDELSYSKLKSVYVQVYRETFSQEEINGIIAFYGSPAGQAMVKKTPVAMQKAGALMQDRVGPMTQKLQGMMQEFQKDVENTK